MIKSALYFERVMFPSVSSNFSKKISIFDPISGKSLLSNSERLINPSDLKPISTITSLSLIPITFAEIIWFSEISLNVP